MSKYFELLEKAGKDLSVQPMQHDAAPRFNSAPSPSFRPAAPPESNLFDWLRMGTVLRRHWKFSSLFAAVVMFTVMAVTLLTKPVYEPVAKIEVDPPGETFSLDRGGSVSSDSEYLETQAQNLRGERLAIKVIRDLNLQNDPEFANQKKSGKTAAPRTGALPDVQLTPAEVMALGSFESQLKVKRDTASRLILISFASHSPETAAKVANTLAQSFIDDNFETRHQAIMKSSEWLSRQLDDIRGKMETSSQQLAKFQVSIGVADIDENKSTYSEHMGELSRQLTQAESDKIQLQALLKSADSSDPESLPEVRNNPVIQQLRQKLAEQRAELSQTLVVYGKNHPTAKKLQSQVDELQSELNSQQHAVVNSIRASYAAAQARERLMQSEIQGTTKQLDQMARYMALKKELQTNVDLYNSLYARIKEAGIYAASKSGNIRVVDQARVLEEPTRPRRGLNLSIGLLVALVGGVVLALLREEFDDRLRTPDDITNWIGSSNIAIIPAIAEGVNGGSRLKMRLLPGSKVPDAQSAAFVIDRPHSPESEALHSLQASILFAQPGQARQVLLVASSFPGEGKTTVSLNLALALARQGKTCLVDADLRKGNLSSRFGLRVGQGLADYLSGSNTLDEVMRNTAVDSLAVVPAGNPQTNPGQLLCSVRAKDLIESLRQRFQFVVIDSVPVLPFADGRALSPLVDGLVFVGRAGLTTREAMRRSMQLLNEVSSAPVIEFVLNGADMDAPEYQYHRYGYSAYQS